MAMIELNGKYGFLDKTGKEVVPCKYDDIGGFSEGLVRVCINGKWGVINKTGKVVIPIKYDKMEDCKNGVVKATLNGRNETIRIPK